MFYVALSRNSQDSIMVSKSWRQQSPPLTQQRWTGTSNSKKNVWKLSKT